MIRYILFTSVIFLIACSSKEEGKLDDWELSNTEQIEHMDTGNRKIQVIYSTLNTGLLNFVDTSIVIRRFVDTLLLEEIQYNLEDGDSSKWSHTINNYNSAGLLIEEIDSINGSLRRHVLHFFENDKLTRSEFLTIIPNYNDSMELTTSDTIRSIVHNYYDEEGRCSRVMALSKDELSSKLVGTMKFDTTLTFNRFDERGNKTRSASITNGDTTSITIAEYDEFNREVKFTDASLEFGANTLKFEYDEQGNRISELMITDDFSELIVIEFDKLNRPIARKTYRSNTLANTRL